MFSDSCCFYEGGSSCIDKERRCLRWNSSPEDQGEEAEVKGRMEQRALRDCQGRRGIGAATVDGEGRTGADTKRRKSGGPGLGYFTRVSRAENQGLCSWA